MDGSTDGCATIAYGLGNMLAVVISWDLNHSVLWGILHGVFGWFYVLYYALFL